MGRRHLQFILSGQIAEKVELLRQRWDPVMAARAPAHISLVYPEEHEDEALLMSRTASAADQQSPFKISIGTVSGEHNGRGGVWFLILDPSRTWETLRVKILSEPFRQLQTTPHVTIAHPRTTTLGPQALAELATFKLSGEVELSEIAYTETDSRGSSVLKRFQLLGVSKIRVAGAILRDGSKVLLCLRKENRINYPGVWDIPGGHLEKFETPAEALTRELGEELGIIPLLSEQTPWETQFFGGTELSVFVVDHWSGEVQNLAEDEHEELRWVTLDEVAQLELSDPRLADLLARAIRA